MKAKSSYSKLLFSAFGLLLGIYSHAQTRVSGRIVDAKTQEPIAFANVVFTGTNIGTTSNFEGYYELETVENVDSISVLFLGYEPKSKGIIPSQEQTINFQLLPNNFKLDEISVLPGENPAHSILRKLWKNKKTNNIDELESYAYESYTRVQVDVDNLSDKFRNRRIMKPFTCLFDSLDVVAGEDGNPVLPIFVSETLSDFYFQKTPLKKKEIVKATHISGVGMEDGTYISQFVGSSFHDYNFYQNSITLLERNIISPVGENAIGFYIHILEDSLYVDNKWCYQIKVVPKRQEDLAFNGTVWIQDTTYALVKFSLEVTADANLNFVERLKIQQELTPSVSGPWVPSKTRILMDVAEPTDESFGMLAKIYVSNDSIRVNEAVDERNYDDDLQVTDRAQEKSDSFWIKNRHDPLSASDVKVFSLVDSVRNFPRVRSYIDLAKALSSGYIDIHPKLEYGSFLLTYGTNVVEKHRLRAGLRTTGSFSKQIRFKGYGAYGFRDQRFKYGLVGEAFLSRRSWTKIGFQYKRDLEGIGTQDDYEDLNPLLEAATQLGLLDRLNWVEVNRAWIHRDIHRSITQKVIFTRKSFSPEGNFVFAYFKDRNTQQEIGVQMQTTEVALETRWAPKETKLINDNLRTRINVNKAPAFTARYSRGFKGLLNGDFNYHRFDLDIRQIARLGFWGRAEYIINYNKVFTPLPYTLLPIIPGNETFIRTLATFNTMDFFEFVADEVAMLFYVHHFDGLLTNRIPALKKLKWRTVTSSKFAFGRFSSENLDYLPEFNAEGEKVSAFNTLQNGPYIELGYGFENIFKFVRIQAFHRLTYRHLNRSNFFVKGSVYFNF